MNFFYEKQIIIKKNSTPNFIVTHEENLPPSYKQMILKTSIEGISKAVGMNLMGIIDGNAFADIEIHLILLVQKKLVSLLILVISNLLYINNLLKIQ